MQTLQSTDCEKERFRPVSLLRCAPSSTCCRALAASRPPRYQWVASPHLCASAHRPPTRGRSGSVPLVVVAPPARPLRGRHRWDHNTHTYTAEASDVPFCPSRPRSRRSTAVTPPERASDHCGAGHGVSRPSRPRAPSRSKARRDSGSRKSVRATLRLRARRAGPYLRKPHWARPAECSEKANHSESSNPQSKLIANRQVTANL